MTAREPVVRNFQALIRYSVLEDMRRVAEQRGVTLRQVVEEAYEQYVQRWSTQELSDGNPPTPGQRRASVPPEV